MKMEFFLRACASSMSELSFTNYYILCVDSLTNVTNWAYVHTMDLITILPIVQFCINTIIF